MNDKPLQHDRIVATSRPPLPRWCYLLRYHQPGQLVRRLRNICRQRWLKKFGAASYGQPPSEPFSLRDNNALTALLTVKLDERRSRGAQQTAEQIAAGQFCFLQQTLSFSDAIDWRLTNQADEVDALWRFHLHYHEYLLDLLAATKSSELSWEIVVDWIENNRPRDGQVFGDAGIHFAFHGGCRFGFYCGRAVLLRKNNAKRFSIR